MNLPTNGTPNLVDLQTSDSDASGQFYRSLLGWQIDEPSPSGYQYARTSDGTIIAGLRSIPGDAPPAWTLYLSTDDAEHTAALASRNGGNVLHGPVEVPGQGSVVLVADPTGAVIGFWQAAPEWRFAQHTPGAFAWAELLTPDGVAADAFYTSLSSINITQIGDGQAYDYTVWTPAGQGAPVVGRHHTALPEDLPAHWRIYFALDPATGTDQTVEHATQLGATTIVEPTDIPAGRIAVLTDPAGAQFALLTPTRRD